MLFDQRGGGWVEVELVRLPSEIWKLNSVVEKTSAVYCSSVLCTLEVYRLDNLVVDLERFESLLAMGAGPFEHSMCS